MKKLILFCFLIINIQSIHAQNIPNADFSDIYIGAIDRLRDWGNSEGCQWGMPFGVMYYVGFDYTSPEYYITLRTKTDTSGNITPSFLFCSSIQFNYNAGCDEDFIYIGQPFPHRPNKMLGGYRFRNDSLLANDFGTCTVILKKFNTVTQQADTIGYGFVQLTPTPADTLEEFSVDIQYLSNQTPDSIVVIFYSTGPNMSGGVLSVDDLYFDFSSSTQSILDHQHFSVFPNPASDYLQIQSPYDDSEAQITIYTIHGQIVRNTHFKNEVSYNIKDLANGIYLVKIESQTHHGIYKIIKH
jgi:hypothetical protein